MCADELGNLLQRKFKTSCSVTRLPGKVDTGKEIALQGNLLQARLFPALYAGLTAAPALGACDTVTADRACLRAAGDPPVPHVGVRHRSAVHRREEQGLRRA